MFPSITGLVADNKGYHIAMCVPLIGFFVAFSFPIYLNTLCAKELDGFRETKIGYVDGIAAVEGGAEERKRSVVHEEKGMGVYEAEIGR